MTLEDVKEVTEVAKERLKENGDIYSEHILAYISYLEKQIEKMKCCENCKKHRNRECPEDKKFFARVQRSCKDWEMAE